MISGTMACFLMAALPPAPVAPLPGVARDVRTLVPHLVLLVTDGDTLTVKKPAGGTMRVRLLGVAPPPTDSPYLRGKYLEDQLKGRSVGLDYDPERGLDRGRVPARVYRLPDGLPINLAMVEAGFGVAAMDAPPALLQALRSAEQGAREQQLGLWSPTALDAAAAHDRETAQLREVFLEQTQQRADKKTQRKINRALANAAWMAIMPNPSPAPSPISSSYYSSSISSSSYSDRQTYFYPSPYQTQPYVQQVRPWGAMSQGQGTSQGYPAPSSSSFNGTGLTNNGHSTTSSFNGTGLDNNGRSSSSSSSSSSGMSGSGHSSHSGFAGYPR